jgi:hypothetical protein
LPFKTVLAWVAAGLDVPIAEAKAVFAPLATVRTLVVDPVMGVLIRLSAGHVDAPKGGTPSAVRGKVAARASHHPVLALTSGAIQTGHTEGKP